MVHLFLYQNKKLEIISKYKAPQRWSNQSANV